MPKISNKLHHDNANGAGVSKKSRAGGPRRLLAEGIRARFLIPKTALALLGIFFLFFASPIQAEEMSGGGYIIKMGTINLTGGIKTSPGLKLRDTVGQSTQGQFEGAGYRARAGFAYLPSREPFSFSVSTPSVDFGTIKPGVFAVGNVDLMVNAAGIPGYNVSVIEDHPLTSSTGDVIPDTACDASDKCTVSHASPWTSSLAYGFGYNMSGVNIDTAEFRETNYFRPFPNNTANQNPTVVMSKRGPSPISSAKLTLQINVPPTQKSGAYKNTLQFIALPSF